jgi:hypothetical protein
MSRTMAPRAFKIHWREASAMRGPQEAIDHD